MIHMIINKTFFFFLIVFFFQKNISIAQAQRKQKYTTSSKECFMLKFGYNLLFVKTDINYFLKKDTIEILQICAVNPQAVYGRSYNFFDNKVNTCIIKSIVAREPQYDKKNDSLIAWWSDTMHIFRVTLFFQNNLNRPVLKNSLSYNLEYNGRIHTFISPFNIKINKIRLKNKRNKFLNFKDVDFHQCM